MASTALLSTLTKRDATTLATVARIQFPDKLLVTLQPEAKVQHDLLLKLGGELVAHQDPALPWDSAFRYDQDHGYEQLELKVPQPLENKKAVSSFAELCGVTDANWVEFKPKDWGNGFGLEKLLNAATSSARGWGGQASSSPSATRSWAWPRSPYNATLAKLDARFATSKAIEKDDDDDSDEELYYKYEKDQPAGAILKFVANKYLEVYGADNRRVP